MLYVVMIIISHECEYWAPDLFYDAELPSKFLMIGRSPYLIACEEGGNKIHSTLLYTGFIVSTDSCYLC